MIIDKTIINKCKQKDRKAQEELYYKIYPYIMGICYRYFLSKDDSKEIANMAIYKILTNIQNYDDNYAFSTWVSKITVNEILSEFRKRKKYEHINYVDTYYDNKDVSVINEYLETMNYKEILNLIEKLSEMEKVIFNLFFIDGLSHKEISGQLNISESASKWYLNQAKNKLRNLLKNEKNKNIKNTINE
ncbi:MAG: hypothetical protein KatS3mg028_0087 [Bacteroidia bacterium]|nr:MAG: hypothetical protein KatS3mg028_0087 [Bacteroidia bacterium]